MTITVDDVIATLEGRKVTINARHVMLGTYVLAWDNGLFVHSINATEASASGFEHAAFFGDRTGAEAFLKRTQIRNGRNEHPHPVLAFNAKQGAVIELDRVIADITSRKEA